MLPNLRTICIALMFATTIAATSRADIESVVSSDSSAHGPRTTYLTLGAGLGSFWSVGSQRDAVSDYVLSDLNVGCTYKRLAVGLGVRYGKGDLTSEYRESIDFDPPETDILRVSRVSASFGYRIWQHSRWKLVPAFCVAWNAYIYEIAFERTDVVFPDVDWRFEPSYSVATHLSFRLSRNETVEKGKSVLHNLSLNVFVDHWSFDQLDFGDGNTIGFSFGYVAEIPL